MPYSRRASNARQQIPGWQVVDLPVGVDAEHAVADASEGDLDPADVAAVAKGEANGDFE